MSTESEVIDACKRLEGVLESVYGATGRGLNEKLDSVLALVPGHVVKRLRYIGTVRNKLGQANGFQVDDLDGYLNTVDFVEKELQKAAPTAASASNNEPAKAEEMPQAHSITRDKSQPLIVLHPTPVSQVTPISIAMLTLLISVIFATKDLLGIAYFFFAVSILILIKPVYKTYSETYLIYEDKVVRKKGIIITTETFLPRSRIITRNVKFTSLSSRMFDYGRVEFASAASDVAEVIFENVRFPKQISEFVYKLGGNDGV